MRDPFFAKIIFAIELKINEGDRLGEQRGFHLTDSNIRSLLIKAVQSAQGKPPRPVAESAGAKDKFLAEFLEQLIAVRTSISVDESSLGETTELQKLPDSEWIASLEEVKHSCSIRTDNGAGSRGYLDFLSGFLAQARGRQ